MIRLSYMRMARMKFLVRESESERERARREELSFYHQSERNSHVPQVPSGMCMEESSETSDIEIFKFALIIACTTTTCIVNLHV